MVETILVVLLVVLPLGGIRAPRSRRASGGALRLLLLV